MYAYAYSNGLGLGDVWPLMDGDSLRFVVLRFRRLYVKADRFDINFQTANRDRRIWMLSASITEYIQVYVSVDFTATSRDTFVATVIHHFLLARKEHLLSLRIVWNFHVIQISFVQLILLDFINRSDQTQNAMSEMSIGGCRPNHI